MLTRDQLANLYMLHTLWKKRKKLDEPKKSELLKQNDPYFFKLFSIHPYIIDHFIGLGHESNTEVTEALRLVVAGEQQDVDALLAMLDANPRLLLHAGDVRTRSGLLVKRVTIYECCFGEGDPELAAEVGKRFPKIWDENGVLFSEERAEAERARQYEPYRPHFEKLARQIESGESAYDLRPLFNIIKRSSLQDITAALNKDMGHPCLLRDALIVFRNAVRRSESKSIGMHFEHYTTLLQAWTLLDTQWEELSNNYENYDKCYLVGRQIIGWLQRDLSTIDRIKHARAFDNKRTLNFKYDSANSYPDTSDGGSREGLGFDEFIFGSRRSVLGVHGLSSFRLRAGAMRRLLEFTTREKTSSLQNLCAHSPRKRQRPAM